MDEISQSVLQQLITPVAIIPACGLLCLSTNARLTSVLGRIRTLHRELLDHADRLERRESTGVQVRTLRLEGLEHQSHSLLKRASMLRTEMILLFFAIICMIITALVLGLSTVARGLESAGAVTLALGLVSAGVAMGIAIVEMSRSTQNVRYEHDRIEELVRSLGEES
ncbi:MAG: DUF2721 domain-containing protein [Phycisphaerales bacterium JB043]